MIWYCLQGHRRLVQAQICAWSEREIGFSVLQPQRSTLIDDDSFVLAMQALLSWFEHQTHCMLWPQAAGKRRSVIWPCSISWHHRQPLPLRWEFLWGNDKSGNSPGCACFEIKFPIWSCALSPTLILMICIFTWNTTILFWQHNFSSHHLVMNIALVSIQETRHL